ncbi:hypothetical protein HHK36_007458 [Tetracentron sinense]|uniref:Beta-amylase n=1 Tax=Tetracentron sinense TaxID=13715 RepID=A0A834ZJB5_TETSI|nr:hypothetical protein HHK36_007458 [Tetracentron sinense]
MSTKVHDSFSGSISGGYRVEADPMILAGTTNSLRTPAAEGIFHGTGALLSGKVAGIHWHYRTKSHAAELTVGYYNTRHREPSISSLSLYRHIFRRSVHIYLEITIQDCSLIGCSVVIDLAMTCQKHLDGK